MIQKKRIKKADLHPNTNIIIKGIKLNKQNKDKNLENKQ
jgi:hypothetical protein